MIKIKHIKKRTLYIILSFFIFCICIIFIFTICKKSNQEKTLENHIKQPKDIVINTEKSFKCNKGILTISKDGKDLYVYFGEIKIINDGNDGNYIEVFIDYPYENIKLKD